MDLVTLASHLGLSDVSKIAKIKERLAPAIAELELVDGFLETAAGNGRFRKVGPGRWTVRFERKSGNSGSKETPPAQATVKPAVDDPATTLVRGFYSAWSKHHHSHVPTPKELTQAREVLGQYGDEDIEKLLKSTISLMRSGFPDARAFGATMHFWREAATKCRKRAVPRDAGEDDASSERERIERWRVRRERWKAIPDDERRRIAKALSRQSVGTLKRQLDDEKFDDPLVIGACLAYLDENPSPAA